MLIDKQVVHDASQPRARAVKGFDLIKACERLDHEFLKQVFAGVFAAGKPPGESIESGKMRSNRLFESSVVVELGHYDSRR